MISKVQVGFKFVSGYIANPFWPARDTLINIGKDVHPKLQGAKRQAAIQAALEKRGLNSEDWDRLQKEVERAFYTKLMDGTGEIIIPIRVVQSFINHTSMTAPKAIPRMENKGLTFIAVRGDYLNTGKTPVDAKLFERFVKNEESNQRQLQVSKYIDDFIATGILTVDEDLMKADSLRKLFEWGGKMIGIGSSRPQGYGRFVVSGWDVIESQGEVPKAA
jgi:hypothetical protein